MFLDKYVVVYLGVIVLLIFTLFTFPTLEKLKWKRDVRKLTKMPHLYRCDNNGITALVLAKDYEKAVGEYWYKVHEGLIEDPGGMFVLYVIPETMVFCSDKHYYPRSLNFERTGNIDQYKQLVKGCRVENRMFFVPYSSFVSGEDWQYRKFKRYDFIHASLMVHRKELAKKVS